MANAAVVCAENVALLSLLYPGRVAKRAEENPLPDFPDAPGSNRAKRERVLPLKKELDLTSTLAFLSGIDDNPLHVLAVAVEELSETNLKVALAINKRRPDDGNKILQTVKEGFAAIFNLMAKVQQMGHVRDIEADIFDEIIKLCGDRILLRARSRTTKSDRQRCKKPKPFLGDQLQDAFELIERILHHDRESTSQVLERLSTALKPMSQIKNASARGERKVSQLRDVVVSILHLTKAPEFTTVLDQIPNQCMNEELKAHLVSRLRKIGRYREAARLLFRLGKQFSLFTSVEIILVLPDAACLLAPTQHQTPAFSTILSRIGISYKNGGGVAHKFDICDPDGAVKTSFREALLGRVHAEIQIALWYDLHPSHKPPRVIAATKYACFLCHEFLKFHPGRYHAPGCHGRLYPAWKLPNWPATSSIRKKFNNEILNNLVRERVARGPERLFTNAPESAIRSLGSLGTTTCDNQSQLSLELSNHSLGSLGGCPDLVEDDGIKSGSTTPTQSAVPHSLLLPDTTPARPVSFRPAQVVDTKTEDQPQSLPTPQATPLGGPRATRSDPPSPTSSDISLSVSSRRGNSILSQHSVDPPAKSSSPLCSLSLASTTALVEPILLSAGAHAFKRLTPSTPPLFLRAGNLELFLEVDASEICWGGGHNLCQVYAECLCRENAMRFTEGLEEALESKQDSPVVISAAGLDIESGTEFKGKDEFFVYLDDTVVRICRVE